ncbi:MAG TPA: heme biosynthesis HemY N-terminal domain-containing protein [Usitatibacter sp.]|jgi:HemY protein|nr:heme biosynthesis HemY N-terminal domain-containing protein [Usitatibacter sp.]
MRLVLWSLVIAALAVGIALFAERSTGYVVIVSAPYRIELSVNLMVFLVAAGYFAFYFLVRLAATLVAIPRRVRTYRAERERAGHRQALNDALLAFFQGRYASAEKSATQALLGEETKGVASIIAARSAHELGRFTEREHFLDHAKGTAPDVDQARLTTLADMLVSQGRHAEALAVLKDLSARDSRNLRLLRLKLQAEQALRNWDEVLQTVASLVKLGGLGSDEAASARRAAHLGNLAHKANDAAALESYWKALPAEMRLDPPVATTAARQQLALGNHEAARAIVEQALEREWNPGLVALYGEAAGSDALPQIERAEKWLRRHARDPALLLALGKLCMKQGLWGKAQSYIEASLALEPTHDGHMTLAALMEQLGKPQEAVRHFRRGAELAG